MSCTTCGGTPQIPNESPIDSGTYVDEYGNPIDKPTSAGGWLDEILKSNCNICIRCLFFWGGVALLAVMILARTRK